MNLSTACHTASFRNQQEKVQTGHGNLLTAASVLLCHQQGVGMVDRGLEMEGWGVGAVTLDATHLVNSSNYSRLLSLMMMIRGVLKGLQRAKCAALAAAESSGASGT